MLGLDEVEPEHGVGHRYPPGGSRADASCRRSDACVPSGGLALAFRPVQVDPRAGRSGGRELTRRSVVTIGAYDGVHLGHSAVIDEVKRLAAALDARSVVVTFDRHPASVVRPESAPGC